MTAYWAYNMFSKCSFLIVNLVLPNLGIWSVNFFMIVPFPGHCLLVFCLAHRGSTGVFFFCSGF